MTAHTDRNFEEELNRLKETILEMGGVVEEMIARAMKALTERDTKIAEEIIKRDPVANRLELLIDDLCLSLLALRQPAASDLRFITIGLRASKDLERMGDLAVNIAEHALELNKEPQLKPYIDLPRMGAKAQEMVRQALDAFVKRDVVLAQSICEMDDTVDDFDAKIYKELVLLMSKDNQSAPTATRLMLISKDLERIADHATNIAEEVIFMVQGRDIRHGGRGKFAAAK
jgi:phosphate transport system protein